MGRRRSRGRRRRRGSGLGTLIGLPFALHTLAERVDTLNATATRIADALEQLVKQHYAASSAAHGPLFHTLLSEEEPA